MTGCISDSTLSPWEMNLPLPIGRAPFQTLNQRYEFESLGPPCYLAERSLNVKPAYPDGSRDACRH